MTSLRTAVAVLLLAGLYFAAAKLSLPLAIPPGYATAVWPPSGIALAALLLAGTRLWPGVWLGAAIVNLTVEASAITAALIATGNTLEALAAAHLVRRRVGVPLRFSKGTDVVLLVAASAASAVIAASVGTLALSLGRSVDAETIAYNWWTWWQGDVCGMVILAPLILTWFGRASVAWTPWRSTELVFFALLLVLASQLIFGRPADHASPVAVPFLLLPLFVWAAFRFGQREVTTAIAATCVISVFHTLAGRGPFAAGTLNESLLALLLFIGVAVFLGLVLSAVLLERERALAELAQQHLTLKENFMVERERSEAELLSAKIAAEQASSAKSEFLAKMSHELRTPLNSLLILAKLLADNAGGNLDARQVRYARTIHDAGNDLLNLINDVLDLAKIEAGAPMVLHLAPLRFDELRDAIEGSFRQLAQSKNLQFAVELDRSLPQAFHTDARRLRQILNNLLSNALKFTLQGSVTLRIRPLGADMVAFDVADTGIGIPPDKHELVFEAFRQVDGGTARRFGGTGLGLSISRELVRLLNGQIRVASAEGGGTVFTLILPLAPAEEPAGAAD